MDSIYYLRAFRVTLLIQIVAFGAFVSGAFGCRRVDQEPKQGPVKGERAELVLSPLVAEAPPNLRLVIDSKMDRAMAVGGNRFPANIVRKMEVVTVDYVGFDGTWRFGQIVVHKDLATEVQAIFQEIRASGFPLKTVIPIAKFGWNDDASVAANNTSGFNYRTKIGAGWRSKTLSRHALGRAIDINPMLNPYVPRSGKGKEMYTPGQPGVLSASSPVVRAFKRRGWQWGGDWRGNKDYQHFEKP